MGRDNANTESHLAAAKHPKLAKLKCARKQPLSPYCQTAWGTWQAGGHARRQTVRQKQQKRKHKKTQENTRKEKKRKQKKRKQKKTKQHKTTQNNTKQHKTKQNKNKTKQQMRF